MDKINHHGPEETTSVVFPDMSVTERVEFLNSILESSTEYSIVAKDLDATILAWNEGARRVYGYEPADGDAVMMVPTTGATAQAETELLAACDATSALLASVPDVGTTVHLRGHPPRPAHSAAGSWRSA